MSRDHPASPAQLAEIKLLVPRIAEIINENQLDTLALNLDEPITVGTPEDHKVYPMRDLLRHMVANGDASASNLVNLVRHINFKTIGPRIQEGIDRAIATLGYAMQPVFASDEGKTPAFCYTLGLSARTGFELIAIAGTDIDLLKTVIDKYARVALNNEDIERERNDLLRMRSHDTYGVRTKCVPVDAGAILKSHMHGTRGEVTKVYQIVIADKNNLFPNEVGYDTKWFQPYLEKL